MASQYSGKNRAESRGFPASAASEPATATHFREVQWATAMWGWWVVLVIAAVFWGILVWEVLARGMPSGLAVTLWVVVGVGLPLAVSRFRLVTEVRAEGIFVRFIPFHLRGKFFAFEEIMEIAARRYAPIREYGGWGIRYGPGGWAYNMMGREGIQLVLVSGRRVLIGTQRPGEFMAAVEALRGSDT